MAGPLAQMVRAKYPGAYDDLSDEQLEQAVVAKYPGVYDDLLQPTTQPSTPPRTLLSRSTPEDFPVVNMAKGAINVVKGIPSSLAQLVTDPVGAARGVLEAQGRVGAQAGEAFQRGDYLTAARKGVNYLVPVLGPALDVSTDKMMQGRIAEGIGEVAANAALTASGLRPRVPKTVTRPPRVAARTNHAEASAVAFARREGIPVDAATATGRPIVRSLQKAAGDSLGGASTVERMQAAQTEGLSRVAAEQAGKAYPTATNPVAAGEAVRNALTKQIEQAHARATAAYESVRAAEAASPEELVDVGRAKAAATGHGSGRAPTSPQPRTLVDEFGRPYPSTPTKTLTPVKMAVDIGAAKKALQPIYQQLKRESELGIPMQGAKGRALAALDGLMRSPDYASLSTVDAALSDLKALSRGAVMPELRTAGQALASQAVYKLDAQVRAAAQKAGPHVLKALEEGRAATKQKYALSDTLDLLSGEPGQVYRQLTQGKDVGLERLKLVQRFAPQELPRVGRAFLEDMIQTATSEGGWAHTDKLWADWNKLGGETKARLFTKQQIQDLNDFFLVSKRIKENPNPSGTARVLTATNALLMIPAWATAKMLMTPKGAKWLTEARIISKSPSRAAQAAAMANITKAAQAAGVPMEMIPALGSDETPTRPSGTGPSGAPR